MSSTLRRSSGWAACCMAAVVSALSVTCSVAFPVFLGDNNTSATYIYEIEDIAAVGSDIYFGAEGPFGEELYKTDGTSSGTSLVKDILPGPGGSGPRGLTELKGELLFVAEDGINGQQIWKSDGTEAGTVIVANMEKDFTSDVYNGSFATSQDKLYFAGWDYTLEKNSLFVCDGTTVTVIEGVAPQGSTIYSDGTLAYFFNSVDNSIEVWRTDGTAAGTFAITGQVFEYSFNKTAHAVMNGLLYFAAGDHMLKTDGTLAGTSNVWTHSNITRPRDMVTIGNTIFFTAQGDAVGNELFKTDGTEAGTVLVKDISPFGDSYPASLTDFGGTLFFFTQNQAELWKSDGTEPGTIKVADLPGYLYQLTTVGGKLFSVMSSESAGYELLVSDGTEPGTNILDLNPGPESSYPWIASGINGYLYSSVEEGPYTGGLVRIDPADLSIITLRPDEGEPASFSIDEITPLAGKLYFSGHSGDTGWEPWVTDGTPAGTHILMDLLPGSSGSVPEDYVEANGFVFFFGKNESGTYDLYRTDGSVAGTILLLPIGLDWPTRLHSAGGFIFFASYGEGTIPLWRSDGTVEGTIEVRNDLDEERIISTGDRVLTYVPGSGIVGYDPATSSSQVVFEYESFNYLYAPRDMVLDGYAYFIFDEYNNNRMFRSDGTASGTELVIEFFNDIWISRLIPPIGGKLFFIIADNSHAASGPERGVVEGTETYELWVTDGDTETYLCQLPSWDSDSELHIKPLGSRFVFTNGNTATGEELWVTDTTGTTGTMLLKDINPGAKASSPSLFTGGADGTVYFTAKTELLGFELWQTDGTLAGTVMTTDLNPGPASSVQTFSDDNGDLSWMLYRENQLLFTANDGVNGHELWLIPAPGMQPEMFELEPGPASSTPARFNLIGETAVFAAWTSGTGIDLWAMPLGHAASVGDWNIY